MVKLFSVTTGRQAQIHMFYSIYILYSKLKYFICVVIMSEMNMDIVKGDERISLMKMD